jgi:dihydrofolate synthase/folylpolyglutamate synthase
MMQLTNLSKKSLDAILTIEKKKKFGLNKIKRFLKKLGNPEQDLDIIHIAGTNGKGSVCAMLSAVLQEAGYSVGMYTSPHLIKFNERIRVNGRLISDKDVEKIIEKLNSIEKKYKIKLTFFETATVAALIYFYEKNVDYVLLETGMGGRLDATNAVNPVLSVITNIGLEHTDYLGNTIKEIASEKAGIIKPKTTIITGAKGTALSIIKKIAKHKKAPLVVAKKQNLKINLKGRYQMENASTAYTILQHLNIHTRYIENGLKKIRWPGRFEFISKNILLDCAHNPEGIKALITSLKDLKYKDLIMVVGIMHDKNAASMLKKLKPLNPKLILTKADVSTAYSPKQLAKFYRNSIIIPNLKKAIEYAKNLASKDDLIVIAGSIYLVGESYSFLNHQTPA